MAFDPNQLSALMGRNQYNTQQQQSQYGTGPGPAQGVFTQGLLAMFGQNRGSNFPGAPGGPAGGFFPSPGSDTRGVLPQGTNLMQYDLERQQGAFDQAFAQQSGLIGEAADMFRGMGSKLEGIGQSGLEEIRGMNADQLAAFEKNKASTLAGAKDRYRGTQASNVAAASGRIASEKARIQNDPNLSAAQKNAMVQELSFGIGQQGYGAASQAFGDYQQLNTGLESQFAGQEANIRAQNTGFVGQGYDRLGQLTAQGQAGAASGMAQLGQLAGSMPQQLVSLFGGLVGLEQFRKNLPHTQQFGMGRGPAGGQAGYPNWTINTGTPY